MRLIHTSTLELVKDPDGCTKYAIISHRWTRDELDFHEYVSSFAEHQIRARAGYSKVVGACKYAHSRGFEWLWIDTVCIDKRSSADLSEAINSMYDWYSNAGECYVYLSDVSDKLFGSWNDTDAAQSIRHSDWFTRAWTLQELVAPKMLLFCSHGWQTLGVVQKRAHGHVQRATPTRLASEIADITGISVEHLLSTDLWKSASVAQKMSWAANRAATRPEDIAYSLVGLFQVNMPVMYGEKLTQAFYRLQREVLARYHDESIFAWTLTADTITDDSDLLAPSPDAFIDSQSVFCSPPASGRQSYLLSEQGIYIDSPFRTFVLDETGLDQGSKERRSSDGLLLYLVRLNCLVFNSHGRLQVYEMALRAENQSLSPSPPAETESFLRYDYTCRGLETAVKGIGLLTPELPSKRFFIKWRAQSTVHRDTTMARIERHTVAEKTYHRLRRLVTDLYPMKVFEDIDLEDDVANTSLALKLIIQDIEGMIQGGESNDAVGGKTAALYDIEPYYSNVLKIVAVTDRPYVATLIGTLKLLLVLLRCHSRSIATFLSSLIEFAEPLPRLQVPNEVLFFIPVQGAAEDICSCFQSHMRRTIDVHEHSASGGQNDDYHAQCFPDVLQEVRNAAEIIDGVSASNVSEGKPKAVGKAQRLAVNRSNFMPVSDDDKACTIDFTDQYRRIISSTLILDSSSYNATDQVIIARKSVGSNPGSGSQQKALKPLKYDPEPDDILNLRLALHTPLLKDDDTSLRLIWESSAFQQWNNDRSSRLLVIRGSALRRTISITGTTIAAIVRNSDFPAFWALQSAGTRSRITADVDRVFAMLNQQAVDHFQSTDQSDHETSSEQPLPQLSSEETEGHSLSTLLQRLGQSYVVIDAALLTGNAPVSIEDVTELQGSLNKLMDACGEETSIKIALLYPCKPSRGAVESLPGLVLNLDKL